MKQFKSNYLLLLVTLIMSSSHLLAEHCCYSVSVNHSVNDDCCLVIDIYNPNCNDPAFILEIFDGTNWVGKGLDTSDNDNVQFIYCPPSGTSSVTYRVLYANKYNLNNPHCNTPGFVEGITKKTATVDIDCCKECPEGYQSWLNVTSTKSNDCPDNGCKVTHSFDMPDSISCYTSYKIDTDSNSTAVLPILGDSLSGIDRCIEAGTTFNVSLTLYTDDGDSCIIDKSVECDEPRDTMDFQPPCVPDCEETPFGPVDSLRFAFHGCSGSLCAVQVFFTSREACNIWQDIQIVRMELSDGCSGCSDAYIYQQALLAIMSHNPMGFAPIDTGCATSWRVTQGGCWSDWEYYYLDPVAGITDTIRVLEPCSQTDCCLQPMTVCKTENPQTITITYDSTYVPPSINCDSTWLENPETGWISQCLPKCDWLEDFDDTHTPPDTVWAKQVKKIGEILPDKIGFKFFVLDDEVHLQIRNEGVSDLNIMITDVLGKLWVKETKKLLNGENTIKIPITNFKRGAYFLSIKVHGVIVKTEKFIK